MAETPPPQKPPESPPDLPSAGHYETDGPPIDLGTTTLARATADEAQIMAEVESGLRCRGCNRRVRKGFEFLMTKVVRDPKTLTRGMVRSAVVVCIRPDCGAARQAMEDGLAVRRVNNEWIFLDEPEALARMTGARGTPPPEVASAEAAA